jgi:uncharacterized protein YlxW (UPF0749 family)
MGPLVVPVKKDDVRRTGQGEEDDSPLPPQMEDPQESLREENAQLHQQVETLNRRVQELEQSLEDIRSVVRRILEGGLLN